MGFWPFSGGKRQRAAESTKHTREQSLHSDPSDNVGRLEKASTDLSGNTKDSTRQEQEDKSRRLSKTQRPGQTLQQRSQTAPLPIPGSQRYSQTIQPMSEKQLYQQNPTSQSSLGPENFHVVRQPPTLYARRSEQDSSFARRKSSKRKAEDHAREQEVRAMSSSPIPIPRRPNSFYDTGILQRETREIPGALNRRLHRPASQVSLPVPETLVDVDKVPYSNSFKISMFAALSPRPTIKYDANPQPPRGKQPQRPTPLARPPTVQEEKGAEEKRIDELADDLDAGGLRELMERDKRRKERKKQAEQVRLQRKLERRAERQREEEARKARTQAYVAASATQTQGLGLEAQGEQAAPSDQTEAGPSGTRQRDNADPFADPEPHPPPSSVIRNPFEDEKDMDVMHDVPSDTEPDPPVPVRSPLRKLQTDVVKPIEKPTVGTLSPPISPAPRAADRQSISQASLLHREVTTDVPESASLTGAASDHSSQRLSSWTAFFRRGTRRKVSSSFQGRSTPSEFSNTSRESFARKQQPPPVVTPRTFRRTDSAGTPQRTMSKFREDLPEFPISPPDSRLQSPEATAPPGTASFSQTAPSTQRMDEATAKAEPSAYTPSSPIPTSGNNQDSEHPMELDAPPSAKTDAMLSQSLASIDSEASWLSGKPLHRRSGASQKLQPSRSSLTRPIPGAFESNEPSPSLESPAAMQRDVEETSEDTSKKDETWHAGVGRQPTVVRQASRAKSKEGLLNEEATKETQDSSQESEDEDEDEKGQEEPEQEVTLMRASSVDYKGHARQISAGSARLLNIRRSSTYSQELLSRQPSSASQDKLTQERPPTS